MVFSERFVRCQQMRQRPQNTRSANRHRVACGYEHNKSTMPRRRLFGSIARRDVLLREEPDEEEDDDEENDGGQRDDDVDEGYTPLPRPSNLHMMAQGLPPQDGRHFQTTANSRGNDRRRGRGRGRGHGFDHGRGRGGRLNGQNSSFQAKWNGQHAPEPMFSPQYSDTPTTFASQPTPSYQYQQPFQPHDSAGGFDGLLV